MTGTPADHAQAAAEAIRALNHSTLPGPGNGLVWPSDADAVIAAVQELVSGLPQALTQLYRWLQEAHDAGRVGHDQDQPPGPSVQAITDALALAGAATADLAWALDAARQHSAHLTGTGDPS